MGGGGGAWSIGLTHAQFATGLSIDGVSAEVAQDQWSLVGAWRDGRLSLALSATWIASGQLRFDDGAPLGRSDRPFAALRYAFEPGFAAGFGVSWQALTTYDHPFDLTLSAQLAFATSTLRTPDAVPDDVRAGADWLAFDIRVGAMLSRTFARTLTPYVALRLFGGPIILSGRLPSGVNATVSGSDKRHVQLAAGVGLTPWPVSAPWLRMFVEGAAIAEYGFSAGVSASF
jgi:hypothetical protein